MNECSMHQGEAPSECLVSLEEECDEGRHYVFSEVFLQFAPNPNPPVRPYLL